jgi:hypothetical protein
LSDRTYDRIQPAGRGAVRLQARLMIRAHRRSSSDLVERVLRGTPSMTCATSRSMAPTTTPTTSRTPPTRSSPSAGGTVAPSRRSASHPSHRSGSGPITRPRLRDKPLVTEVPRRVNVCKITAGKRSRERARGVWTEE